MEKYERQRIEIDCVQEILYWLEHTTMSREQIILIFKEKLKEL